MKYLLILLMLPMLANSDCKSKKNKQNEDVVVTDTTKVQIPEATDTVLPACLTEKLDNAKKDNPPHQADKVELYEWNGKNVYLVTWQCCDFFNEVYGKNCKMLCAPTGGITGKGDGNCPDFAKTAKLIKQLLPAPAK